MKPYCAPRASFANTPLSQALTKTFKSNKLLSTASFALILSINSVTPLSFIWLIYQTYRFLFRRNAQLQSKHKLTIRIIIKFMLTIYSSIEVFFYFYQSYLINKAQRRTQIPKLTLDQIKTLLNRYFALITSADNNDNDSNSKRATASDLTTKFFEQWAFNTDYTQIGVGNVMNWVSFSFLGSNLDELNENDSSKLKQIITDLTSQYNVKLNDGYNKNVPFMKPFLGKLDIRKRPWIYYAVTDSILLNLGHLILTANMGFKFKKQQVLSYWVHTPTTSATDSNLEPLVFVHGIGAGILMYLPFLRLIHSKYESQRTIIIINLPCISMRYPSLDCSEIADRHDTLQAMQAILKEECILDRKCVYIGHSFGTMIVSWILNASNDNTYPFGVKQCIFIDPICFKLYEPDITYNFVYRNPSNVAQLFMWYFVCREFGIAYVIGRHFWWFQSIVMLDKNENKLRKPVIQVFLSENDCIVNSETVKKYLELNNTEYHIGKRHIHSSFLARQDSWNKIIEWIDIHAQS